jgi:hypothetical protein
MYNTGAIHRTNSVNPQFAVQPPGLATLRRYSDAFPKSREAPITVVMTIHLSECKMAALNGPDFHEM